MINSSLPLTLGSLSFLYRLTNLFLVTGNAIITWVSKCNGIHVVMFKLSITMTNFSTLVLIGIAPYGQLPDNDPTNPRAKLDADFRKYYHPLFTQYGVHLVVSSGLNNYQRTHVLGYNESNPVTPTAYLTSEAPNYTIAAGSKNFGATGSIFVNTTSGTRKPIHNVPDANIQTYVHKTVIPTGVLYLKIHTAQRTASSSPIMDCFLYEYYYPVTPQSVGTEPVPLKVARDHFSIIIT